MDATEDTRLNAIQTLWTIVRLAHDQTGDAARAARGRLLERYIGAVRRYLLGALKDADAADEVASLFSVKFMEGGLAGADPERGRFRDFVKGVLFNLIPDYHRKKAKLPRQLADDAPEQGADCALATERDAAFEQSWREEILARVWLALERHEPTYHAVLRLRTEQPDSPSHVLAETLSARTGKPVTAAGVRKTLERARAAFGDLLLEDIADGLEDASRARLEDELADLGLLEMTREALARRFPPGPAS